jgi:hypothetical protein
MLDGQGLRRERDLPVCLQLFALRPAPAMSGYGLRGSANVTACELQLSACANQILDADKHGINVARAETLYNGGYITSTVNRQDIEDLCAPISCLVRCGMQKRRNSGPADALANWGPFFEDRCATISPDAAPSYLLPLLTRREGDEAPSEPLRHGEIARQLVDDPDEGGDFLAVILARATE